jgi:hypothetical protein
LQVNVAGVGEVAVHGRSPQAPVPIPVHQRGPLRRNRREPLCCEKSKMIF